ncbi:hypothetical protein PPYR_04236 [Photinus pyralis]|uniref:Bromo domain-containing protein n=2 Tax=Photinus pyralis TaxID=7054 RepID=A0A5N4AY04_PHOPY|nr:bromodomain and WD repeat-containing protein 3 [Photinus pyralis]KAB0802050.1 hypothetical protein PPYR_04236 [Photinus pyralis]
MSSEAGTSKGNEIVTELYFLIQKCLSVSPLKETHQMLVKELESSNILPNRLDWKGNEHRRNLAELEKHYPHIGPDYLLKICSRLGCILDRELPPSIKRAPSLLGAGRQSLLRRTDHKRCNNAQLYYAARIHGKPLLDPPFLKSTHNIVNVCIGRQMSGPTTRHLVVGSSRYANLQLQRRTLGHLSAVYCLLFDRTGRFIVTGADDLLIKVWSSTTGRLLATFRGASSELTDIAINLENTLLAAGSIDRILRVWNLQFGYPVAVLVAQAGIITSVNFCPSSRWDVRYLISTSTDGSVAFWSYSLDTVGKAVFVSKPIIYQEKMRPGQAQMICSSFSPGGLLLATGSADHHVRVYFMHGDEGPNRILETQAHTDRVDSIQWSNHSLRFISGSKDGSAHIWNFECQQWKSIRLLMSTTLSSDAKKHDAEEDKKLKVTMVAWDCSDTWVVTAVSDYSLKVWRADNGHLERVLKGHTEEIYVLESHPHDKNVVLSAGHDGQLFIWDVFQGRQVAHFMNNIEGQGYGAIFDAKWSPDGTMIAATDSHGHMLIFGFGCGHPLMKTLPTELFFHTDYRPLVRDNNHVALDEQTQIAPHLMPPPFLVDVDGNPYPPMIQQLVPGREFCKIEQLVPNIVIGSEGVQEVIEGLPEDLERAANSQQREREVDDDDLQSVPRSPRIAGMRRFEYLGLAKLDQIKGNKKILVKPLTISERDRAKDVTESLCALELAEYRNQMKKRPLMINTATTTAPVNNAHKGHRRRARALRRAESVATDGTEGEVESNNSNSSVRSDDSENHEDISTSDSSSECSESSGYSDWVAEHSVNLEPPKRSKRRQTTTNAKKKQISSEPNNVTEEPTTATPKPVINNAKTTKELPEIYKPLEWLSETMPCKAPYFPQMGDEIVYFTQGHQMYVEAVRTKSVYETNPKDLPWSKMEFKDHEFVKVVGIKYEIRPPRLCCLKLALLDSESRLTGNIFTIKYHDMADVLDFLVLKQTYDAAISRTWNAGDRFRCMIDDCWWMGKIVSKSPLSADSPNSLFMSYEIQWDSEEFERMSSWDLEPIREDRLPENMGDPVKVLPEEIQNILYRPQAEEWPHGDRESACKKICEGLEKVMGLAIAEPFLAPVDLSQYPTYAYIVEYPIDLSTIKARLENNFYRRITAAQFDVRYLATNAEKFNEPHSIIVKRARIISELCLKIIKSYSENLDVGAVYHQLMDTYQSTDSEAEVIQSGPSTSRSLASLITRRLRHPDDWKHEARALLETLWRCEDSVPFRTPVDNLKHTDYYQVIDTPMDLGTVKEDLLGGNYETPLDFCKDMRLIFQNSKNYNTNKRSRIYAMTIRLSAMFEEHMTRILYNWKIARRRSSTSLKRNLKRSRRKKLNNQSFKESPSEESSAAEETKSKSPTRNMEETNGHVSEFQLSENSEDKNSSSRESSCSSSSSEQSTYKPSSSGIKVKRLEGTSKRKPVLNSYKKNVGRRKSSSSEATNTDDSELPKRQSVKRKVNNLRSRGSTSRVSSDSDDIRTSLRKRSMKRPRYVEDSDSVGSSAAQENGNDTDDTDADVTTVSSRGRVRRLTPRAKALLKR